VAFATTTAPENRDGRPIAYLYAAASWLSKFWPGLIGADWAGAGSWRHWPATFRWGIPVAVVLMLAACGLRPGSRQAALAFVAGLGGMVLETIVLLHYQATQGALFEDLGLLMMAFMAGSAAGAWFGEARQVWRNARASQQLWRRAPALRSAAALTLTALAGWGGLSWWLVSSGIALGLVGATATLAGIGVTVGVLFAAAGDRLTDDGAAGRLYAADVLGGCTGSLAASLVLVPLAGMDLAALIVSGLATASLVLAWGRTRR
jgi:spermidine synthase